jgi:hypothetical protein
MPINNLFNNLSFETGYNVAPLQLISSLDHNNLLNENRNKHLFTQLNADTATGGTGIESRYIANSAVTSSKINLQAGRLFFANPIASALGVIGWNQVWTSLQFGQFNINWEKPFMTAEVDFQALFSIHHSISSNPQKMHFNGNLILFAIENGTPVFVDSFSTDEYNQLFKRIRDGYAQDIASSTAGDGGVYQEVYNRHCKALYTNTSGEASTSFYFLGAIQNQTRYLGGTSVATSNYGSIGMRSAIYKTYNQIHS